MNGFKKRQSNFISSTSFKAFTIVELLVVIVVISILAAITIVSFTGISQKAVAASLQSDLNNASKQLSLYQVEHGSYPIKDSVSMTNDGNGNYCPTQPYSNDKYCIKASSSNTFTYTSGVGLTPQSYTLDATKTNSTISYRITNSTAPTQLAQNMQPTVTQGAVLELHSAKANGGISSGINSPFTTQWFDTSGSGKNGSLTNMAGTTSSGWAGTGTTEDPYNLVIDATNDRVELGDLSVCEDKTFSYEAWVKTTVSAVIIAEDNKAPSGYHLSYLIVNSQKAYFALFAGGSNYGNITGNSIVDDNEWHHIVGVHTGTKLRLYVDGASDAIETTPNASWNPTIINAGIGAGYWNGTWQHGGGMSIAAARIYPFALSAAQVSANYAAGPKW